jgi:hypothetical protein
MNDTVLFRAHTPSGPTLCCAEHAEKLVALFNFMGCHVHLEPIFGKVTDCENCKNEEVRNDNR